MDASERSAAPISLFYSYSREDEELRKKLVNHLAPLRDDGVIRDWHDRRIEPGTEWDGFIKENLDRAGIILFLVSADFLASRYCRGVEVPRAMEHHEAGTARIIPAILRPVDWRSAPFGKLQPLSRDGKPVIEWRPREKDLADIARGMREVARGLVTSARGVREPAGHLLTAASNPVT